jgi:hypothetical protein
MAFRYAVRAAARVAQVTTTGVAASAEAAPFAARVGVPSVASFARGFAAEPAPVSVAGVGKVTQVCFPPMLSVCAISTLWRGSHQMTAINLNERTDARNSLGVTDSRPPIDAHNMPYNR